VVLTAAVAGAVLFGVGSAMQEPVYRTSVDVGLAPVSPRSLYDPEAAGWGPEVALARELQFTGTEAVQDAIADALDAGADAAIEFSPAGEGMLRVQAEASNPDAAANAASVAAAAYAEVREATAAEGVEDALAAAQAQVDELAGEGAPADDPERVAAEAQLVQATEASAAVAAGTAYITGDPVVPCCAVAPQPQRAAVLGFVLGALLGVAVAAVAAQLRASPSTTASTWSRVLGTAEQPEGHGPRRRVMSVVTGGGRATLAALAGLVVLRAAVHVWQGTNLVLDDWVLAGNAERFGFDVVPVGQDLTGARPGAWATFTVLYGVIGAHPLALFAVVTVINVLIVWVLYAVASRFLSVPTAACVAALWVVLPTHTTLTVWAGTTQVVVGLLLFLLGVWALTHGRWMSAGLALAASILCYELVIPLSIVLPLVAATPAMPLRPEVTSHATLDWARRAGVLVPVVAATAWSRTHSIYETEISFPSLSDLWSAHFGLGLFGSFATPEWLAVLTGGAVAAGVAVCLVAWIRGERGRDQGPSLVVAGGLLMALGVPAAFTLPSGPLGFADRLYGITTIGSALVLVGITMWMWRRTRTLATVGVVTLLSVCVVGQVVAMSSWSRAGDDVVALLRHIDEQPSSGSTVFLVEPGPLNRNGVIGASSPFGGANEAYLLRYPDATGQLFIADGETTLEGEVVVIDWADVLDGG
jgi:hypothetical protein